MLIHKTKGLLKFKRKGYQALGNKVKDIYVDENGKEHELDGTETPVENYLSKMDDFSNEERSKKIQSEVAEKLIELEDDEEDKNLNEKQAYKEEKTQRHSELLSEVKNASESIVEAVNAIPEIEIPDHIKEYEAYKNEIIKAIEKTIVEQVEQKELDLTPVITAIEKIKFPEINFPKPIDYSKILEQIKKSLPKDTDLTGVIEAIKSIPQPVFPNLKFNKDGRLEVEVDRISIGASGGGLGTADSTKLQTLATEAKQDAEIVLLGDIITAIGGFQIPANDYISRSWTAGTFTEVWTFKTGGSTGTTVGTITIIYDDVDQSNIVSVTKT
jgi:hypothetical protein